MLESMTERESYNICSLSFFTWSLRQSRGQARSINRPVSLAQFFWLNFCTNSFFFLFFPPGEKRKKDKLMQKFSQNEAGFLLRLWLRHLPYMWLQHRIQSRCVIFIGEKKQKNVTGYMIKNMMNIIYYIFSILLLYIMIKYCYHNLLLYLINMRIHIKNAINIIIAFNRFNCYGADQWASQLLMYSFRLSNSSEHSRIRNATIESAELRLM